MSVELPAIAAYPRGARERQNFFGPTFALHTQAVLQGAFILAKAKSSAAIAAASVDHLRRYVELLFQPGHIS